VAIANQMFWDKYEGARVEDEEFPGPPWVDFAIISKLLDKWDKDTPIDPEKVERLYVRCSDEPGANVMRYDGEGWYAIGTMQAKAISTARGWDGELFRGA